MVRNFGGTGNYEFQDFIDDLNVHEEQIWTIHKAIKNFRNFYPEKKNNTNEVILHSPKLLPIPPIFSC